jgi:nicotinamidase-related amidase
LTRTSQPRSSSDQAGADAHDFTHKPRGDPLLDGRPQDAGSDEIVIYKPRWGAFYEPALEVPLRRWDISSVVFCGCNFPNCPRTSIYEASERDFRIVLINDAISGLYDKGCQELASIGVRLMSTADVIESLVDIAVWLRPLRGPTARRR